MSDERGEYELGRDVTAEATGTQHRGMAVLAVRLPIGELVALETASEAAGTTPAQLVREAVRSYLEAGRSARRVG